MVISEVEIIFRLLLGALLGALVGFERERQGQPAGLRTHTILAVGSTLAMTMSINIAMQFRPTVPNGDPARLAAQVISGIGFLGAGAILRYGTSVKGLTTATSLWTIAIVGLAVGAGHYFSAVATAMLLLGVLTLLNILEKKVIKVFSGLSVVVTAEDRPGVINEIQAILVNEHKRVSSTGLEKDLVSHTLTVAFFIRTQENEPMEATYEALGQVPGVLSFKIS